VAADKLSISVFLPCHNEAGNIEAVVERAVGVLEELGADFEVIVVDDGSRDGTGEIADAMAGRDERIRAVHHERNLGYGAALRSGFAACKKEFVFYTDGDGQFDIGEMPSLLPLMEDCDIVSCYRLDRRDGVLRVFFGWLWSALVSTLFALKIRDVDCAFKLYRRRIFDDIELSCSGAVIDSEVLVKAARAGYKITQRGVRHYPRKTGRQSGASIRVLLRAFAELFRFYRRLGRRRGGGMRPCS
jgi:glycosyltransferase involved in cell wall biosynthesis